MSLCFIRVLYRIDNDDDDDDDVDNGRQHVAYHNLMTQHCPALFPSQVFFHIEVNTATLFFVISRYLLYAYKYLI